MKQCLAVVGGEAGVEMLSAGTGSFPHFPVIFRRAFLSSTAMGAKAVCKSRLNSVVFGGGLEWERPGLLESWVCEY